MTNLYYNDVEALGYIERKKLAKMWDLLLNGNYPKGFDLSNLKFGFNSSTGYVFFTNEDYDTLILEDDKLVEFHYLDYDGHEGTLATLIDDYVEGRITNIEDICQLIEICVYEYEDEPLNFFKTEADLQVLKEVYNSKYCYSEPEVSERIEELVQLLGCED